MRYLLIHKQQGATLAISLILLFVTTLVGVATVQVTNLQERMSSNSQDKMVSFEAAESALLAGETWVLNLTQLPVPEAQCTTYPCVLVLDSRLNIFTKGTSWWKRNGTAFGKTLVKVYNPPRYRIDFLRFVPDSPTVGTNNTQGVYFYQVTAYATGNTTKAVSLLQTTVARRF